jgi:hypothetical protein
MDKKPTNKRIVELAVAYVRAVDRYDLATVKLESDDDASGDLRVDYDAAEEACEAASNQFFEAVRTYIALEEQPTQSTCLLCGTPICWTGKYWEHTDSNPRHIAKPA